MVNPATFEISSTYEEVRRAAGWLRENVAGALQPDRIDDLEFATVEALTNIVRHAYADAPGQPINLTLQLGQERLDLLIRDKGRAPPQDLLDRGPPDDDDLLNQMAEVRSWRKDYPGLRRPRYAGAEGSRDFSLLDDFASCWLRSGHQQDAIGDD